MTSSVNLDYSKTRFLKFLDSSIVTSLILLILILPVARTNALRYLFFITGIVLFVTRLFITRDYKRLNTELNFPFAIYIGIAILSLFTSVNLINSINQIKGELFEVFALFLLVVGNIVNRNRILIIYLAILAGLVLMVTYGLWDFFVINKAHILERNGLMKSLHTDAQYFSAYLVVVFPLAFVPFFLCKDWKRYLFLLLFVITLFTLFLADKRGQWIAVSMEIVISPLLLIKRKKLSLIIFLLLVLVIALLSLKLPFHKGFLPTKDKDRLEVWLFTLKNFWEHPFYGIGFGRDSLGFAFPDVPYGYSHPHNFFINLLIEMGIQGLIVFLWIQWRILNLNIKGLHQGGSWLEESIFISTIVMMIGVFTLNLFDDLFVDDLSMLYWLIIGLSFSTYYMIKKRGRHDSLDIITNYHKA